MLRQDPTRQEAIDEDINQLEHDVRQYKIEFEQYFGGGKQRPPNDIEWRVEALLKRYGDRGAQMNYTQRFRFGNLVQTYTKFREVFHKRLRKREEGSTERHYGAAARVIAADRAAGVRRKNSADIAVSLTDPSQETEKVEQLYAAFREALRSSGESTDRLSPKQFEGFLQKKTAEFHKEEVPQEVEFVVTVEAGRARLKARVRS